MLTCYTSVMRPWSTAVLVARATSPIEGVSSTSSTVPAWLTLHHVRQSAHVCKTVKTHIRQSTLFTHKTVNTCGLGGAGHVSDRRRVVHQQYPPRVTHPAPCKTVNSCKTVKTHIRQSRDRRRCRPRAPYSEVNHVLRGRRSMMKKKKIVV